MLTTHHNIASIFFLIPSGDLYMGEPYEQQEQLPKLNYVDRDWYKGVVSTYDPYVSSVFMSAAIHEPAVAIAVPSYAPYDAQIQASNISGYWVAIVSLTKLQDSLVKLDQGSGQMIIFVDHNGTGIAITASPGKGSGLQGFSNLGSVKAALAGKTGSQVEVVNGTRMNIYYAPASIHPHTWAVLLMEPAFIN